ncbi:hypothetical protein NDU88_000840 [Pleurodeles waltl]|uniref:Uncharacterized protein n=1 Tax=Pleurodeles waltl TaxID=8319 RepID=A0AAV7U4L8_PLEWA|nr:hypothetical protein NDU88_000840 [Pleurodeles waltl]
MLNNINATTALPPPTTPWASDSLQNSVQELKRQVEALGKAHNVPSLQVTTASPCVNPTPGSLSQATLVEKEQGKVTEQSVSAAKALTSAEGTGLDTLLFRPGKLAAHVAPDIKEKIWKGEFVDIFSLIRAKRRDVETKDKDSKASSSSDEKPKIEESITNWLFGFNVFMSVMLERKPETGIAMICYANKILKAHHMYGGNAWLEYDRDFRWAKVEDPAIGWDQTEVNVCLECVNNKLPSKQPFRAQYMNDKKGSCWAFHRKVCRDPWPLQTWGPRIHTGGILRDVRVPRIHTGGVLKDVQGPRIHTGGVLRDVRVPRIHTGGILRDVRVPRIHTGGVLRDVRGQGFTLVEFCETCGCQGFTLVEFCETCGGQGFTLVEFCETCGCQGFTLVEFCKTCGCQGFTLVEFREMCGF